MMLLCTTTSLVVVVDALEAVPVPDQDPAAVISAVVEPIMSLWTNFSPVVVVRASPVAVPVPDHVPPAAT